MVWSAGGWTDAVMAQRGPAGAVTSGQGGDGWVTAAGGCHGQLQEVTSG